MLQLTIDDAKYSASNLFAVWRASSLLRDIKKCIKTSGDENSNYIST
jgi:hypothetical protein